MSISAINVRNQSHGEIKEVFGGLVVADIDVATPSAFTAHLTQPWFAV